MTRYNLVTNPSFRDGLTGYAALNSATLEIDTDYAFYGANSLEVTKSLSSNSGVATTVPIPVVAGLPYAASVYVRLPNTIPAEEAANLMLTVEWRNSANTIVNSSESTVLSLTDDDNWARLSGVWVAPIGATVAYLRVTQTLAGTLGQRFLVDALLFEQNTYVGGYVDNLTQAEENVIVNKALTLPPDQVVSGMQLNADIMLNDLVLNTIDEFGTVWVCTNISGWYGQSSPEIPDIPRGTEDGSYDVSGRYQARVITVSGVFFPADTGASLSAARDRLVTAVNLVRKGGWLRTNEEPTKAAFVRLSGAPQIATVNARGRTEFTIGLRAGDPVKYHWNDSDPEGFSQFHLDAADDIGIVRNIGTADVTGIFTITGPAGAGTRIYNAATDETLTLVEALRGSGLTGTISTVSLTDNIVTLKTTAASHLIEGDEIVVSGAGLPFDTVDTTATVLGVSNVFPYTVSYAAVSDDWSEVSSGGSVALANNDVLEIDTYNRVVSFNGTNIGHRSKLETLTDWIKIAPGNNTIEFHDDVDLLDITNKSASGGIVTLTSKDIHYLIPGESVSIDFPEVVSLSKKSLASNVVTLTTAEPHGFSVGDKINVESTERATIDQKSATTTVATLRTVETNGVNVSDSVVVALPATATPIQKALTSNVATITTALKHGFSTGDSVTVDIPQTAAIVTKLLQNNQATLTTPIAHSFQLNDTVTVALPIVATISTKQKSGAQAIMTTSTAHGFSVGDSVVMALPASATITGSVVSAGYTNLYLVTITTDAAHGFALGDRITLNLTHADINASPVTITNRVATTTTCTLTHASGKGPVVGEKVTVSGVSSRYNGTFYVTAVTATTFTYANAGTAESSTASSGTFTNQTFIETYTGSKFVEQVPTSTTFTFHAFGQEVAATRSGLTGTIVNDTNVAFNGTKTLVSASNSQFAYNL